MLFRNLPLLCAPGLDVKLWGGRGADVAYRGAMGLTGPLLSGHLTPAALLTPVFTTDVTGANRLRLLGMQ